MSLCSQVNAKTVSTMTESENNGHMLLEMKVCLLEQIQKGPEKHMEGKYKSWTRL